MPSIGEGEDRIHYEWSGQESGSVLVLSHSLGSDLSLWKWNLPAWETEFRILRYDHRGHGRSGHPGGDWVIEDFGNDLIRLLDGIGLDEASLCGVSLGGMVGLWVAQHHPSRLKRLIAANTSAYTEDPSLLERRIALVRSEGVEAISEDVLEKWFTPKFHRARPEVIDHFRNTLRATSSEAYARTSEAVCGLDLRSKLSAIEVPTLVVTSSGDLATPPAWGEAIAEKVPGAKLEQFDAAHLACVEDAGKFGRLVIEFLK